MSDVNLTTAHRLQQRFAAHGDTARVAYWVENGNETEYVMESTSSNIETLTNIASELGLFAWATCRVMWKMIDGVGRVVFSVTRHE